MGKIAKYSSNFLWTLPLQFFGPTQSYHFGLNFDSWGKSYQRGLCAFVQIKCSDELWWLFTPSLWWHHHQYLELHLLYGSLRCVLLVNLKRRKSLYLPVSEFCPRWSRPGGQHRIFSKFSKRCPNNIFKGRVHCHLKVASFGICCQNSHPCPNMIRKQCNLLKSHYAKISFMLVFKCWLRY